MEVGEVSSTAWLLCLSEKGLQDAKRTTELLFSRSVTQLEQIPAADILHLVGPGHTLHLRSPCTVKDALALVINESWRCDVMSVTRYSHH